MYRADTLGWFTTRYVPRTRGKNPGSSATRGSIPEQRSYSRKLPSHSVIPCSPVSNQPYSSYQPYSSSASFSVSLPISIPNKQFPILLLLETQC